MQTTHTILITRRKLQSRGGSSEQSHRNNQSFKLKEEILSLNREVESEGVGEVGELVLLVSTLILFNFYISMVLHCEVSRRSLLFVAAGCS